MSSAFQSAPNQRFRMAVRTCPGPNTQLSNETVATNKINKIKGILEVEGPSEVAPEFHGKVIERIFLYENLLISAFLR